MPISSAVADALQDLSIEPLGEDNALAQASLTTGVLSIDDDPIIGPIFPCSCCMGCFC